MDRTRHEIFTSILMSQIRLLFLLSENLNLFESPLSRTKETYFSKTLKLLNL